MKIGINTAVAKTLRDAEDFAIENKFNLFNSGLVTSCRQTISTIRKVIKAQIPIVISVSAPTDLAIKEAKEFGVTLVGFCRGSRFNIYSHGWRISLETTKIKEEVVTEAQRAGT